MSNMTEVARATVTIVPNMQGSQSVIEAELTGAASAAATKAGSAAGKNLGESISASLESTGANVTKVGDKLTKGVTLPLAGVGTAVYAASSDFETAFAQLITIADTSEVSVEELKDGIKDLSATTGVSMSEISGAMYSAISAGQSTGDALGFVQTSMKLAKGGFTDTATATDVLTTALNAYGLAAEDVTHIGDVLIETQNEGKTTVAELGASLGKVIPTAATANVGFEDLSSQFVALTKNGIGTAEATTYINSMLNELSKSGTEASGTFKDIAGQTFPEYIKSGHSTAEAMQLFGEGLKANQSQVDEIKAVMEELKTTGTTTSEVFEEIAGKSFQKFIASGKTVDDAINLLEKDSSKIKVSIGDAFGSAEAGKAANVLASHFEDADTALKNMISTEGQMEAAFATMDQTTAANMERMTNQFQNLAITLGESLLPILQPVMEQLSAGVSTLSEKWQSLSPEMQNTIIQGAALAAAAGPVLSVGGKLIGGVGKLAGGIGGLIGKIGGATSSIGSIGSAAGGATSSVAGCAGSFGTLAGQALKLVAVGASLLLVGAGIKLIAESAIALAEAGTPAAVAMGALAAGILVFVGVMAALGSALTAGAVGIGVFGAAVLGIGVGIGAATAGISLLVDSISGLVDTISDNAPGINSIIDQIGQSFAGVIDSISGGISGVLNSVAGIFDSIGEAALNAGTGFDKMADGAIKIAGTNLIDLGASMTTLAACIGKITSKATEITAVATGFDALSKSILTLNISLSGGFSTALTTSVTRVKAWGIGINKEFNDTFTGIISITGDKLGQFNQTVASQMNNAGNTVRQGLQNIQGSFKSTEFSFGHIKLPHFRMTGKFDAKEGTVPEVYIEWYKKAASQGAIFSSPQIIGVGDASQPEMLIGENTLFDSIRKAVRDVSGAAVFYNTITVNGAEDPEEWTREFIRTLQREARMA